MAWVLIRTTLEADERNRKTVHYSGNCGTGFRRQQHRVDVEVGFQIVQRVKEVGLGRVVLEIR
jgi:hypothetical protein